MGARVKFPDFTVESHSVVELHDIAGAFSVMTGDQQAIVLQEFFDALKHACKDKAKFEYQLHFIGVGISRYNFKDLEYVFESLLYFMKNNPQQHKEGAE